MLRLTRLGCCVCAVLCGGVTIKHNVASALSSMSSDGTKPAVGSGVLQDIDDNKQQTQWSPRPLPNKGGSGSASKPLAIGYSHDPAGEKIRRALDSGGVNVICWSFLHLDIDAETSQPTVRTDLDLRAIRKLRHREGLESVLHIGAIGGWNAPHLPPSSSGDSGADISITAEAWADTIWDFNVQNGYILDGIDWDWEGHDNRSAPTSKFTLETLNVMADVSMLLKQRYGMLVSMAPAESYFDALAEDTAFSLELNLFPRPWGDTNSQNVDEQADADADRKMIEEANFEHAGRQCYAYVWHRAGGEQTFDWVGLQLYEAYSRYLHETTRGAMMLGSHDDDDDDDDADVDVDAVVTAQVEGAVKRVVALFDGFEVDLPVYGTTRISVLPSRVVLGFGNGWTDNTKFVTVRPETLQTILVRLKIAGFMFWTIEEEGTDGVYMADYIANAVRHSSEEEDEEDEDEDEHEYHDGDDDEGLDDDDDFVEEKSTNQDENLGDEL